MKQNVFFKIFKKGFLIWVGLLIVIGIIYGLILFFGNGVLINGEVFKFSISEQDSIFSSIGEFILSMILASIYGILSIFWMVCSIVIEPIMNGAQDSIFILLSGEIIVSAFNLSYKMFLIIFGSIFVLLAVIFSIMSIFKNQNTKIIQNILKASLIFVAMPLVLFISFEIANLITNWLSESALNDSSIYDNISKYTFDIAMDPDLPILIRTGLVIVGIIMSFMIFFFFMKFLIALAVRIYEVIIFGILGLSWASASSIYDGGEKLGVYNSVLMTKMSNAYISVIGYLVVISVLPAINEAIAQGNFNTDMIHYSSIEVVQLFLIMAVSIGSFIILKSLSTEWAFLISGDTKGGLATQLNQVDQASSNFSRTFKKGTNLAMDVGLGVLTAGSSGVYSTTTKLGKIARSTTKMGIDTIEKSRVKVKNNWNSDWINSSKEEQRKITDNLENKVKNKDFKDKDKNGK